MFALLGLFLDTIVKVLGMFIQLTGMCISEMTAAWHETLFGFDVLTQMSIILIAIAMSLLTSTGFIGFLAAHLFVHKVNHYEKP